MRKVFQTEVFDDITVEHAFISDALLTQTGSELGIYVSENVPQGRETLFEFGGVFYGEMMEKLADGLLLAFFQKFIMVRQVVQVFQVAEQGVSVRHVLVCIVEIGNQHFAPEIELVECFLAAGGVTEYLVKVAYQFDGITCFQTGRFAEQFADAEIGRRPYRASGFPGQIFVEEKAGTLVWENHSHVCQVAPGLLEKIPGYRFEKCIHN